MLTTLDFGQQVDLLNKQELADALADDARLRSIVAGVKQGEMWINSGAPGMGTTFYTSTGAVPQCPAAGYLWAVMNLGVELSAASNLRLYKSANPQTSTQVGNGRGIATTTASQGLQNFPFSKGQFTLKTGDVFTLVPVTGAINILSIFMAYIEIPAERQGELWL